MSLGYLITAFSCADVHYLVDVRDHDFPVIHSTGVRRCLYHLEHLLHTFVKTRASSLIFGRKFTTWSGPR